MYKKKRLLAIIPARGGSKGIPGKNLRKIKGNSLTSIALNFAKKQKIIDEIVVSTDSNQIANEAKKNNLKVPFMRPKKLSGDRISAFKVLEHGLRESEKYFKKKFDYIIMFEPTSPLRKSYEFKSALNKIYKKKLDAVWTVSKVDSKYHPYKQLLIKKDLMKLFSSKGRKVFYRQSLSNTFIRNGAVYIFSSKCLKKLKNIYGKKLGFIVSTTKHISIDTIEDFNLVKKYYK